MKEIFLNKSILKILFSNFSIAIISFLTIFLIRKNLSINDQEFYLKLINYSLIFIPLLEFGSQYYLAALKNISKFEVLQRLIITTLIYIVCVYFVDNNSLKLIVTYAFLLSVNKTICTFFQNLGLWSTYNLLNLINPLLRFLSVIYFILNDYSSLNYVILFSIIISCFLSLVIFINVNSNNTNENNNNNVSLFNKEIFVSLLISIIIGLAMRADQIIIDYLFMEEVYIEYSLMFQFALIFPLITNTLITYYLSNSTITISEYIDVRRVCLITILLIPIIYVIYQFLLPFVFDINSSKIALSGALLTSASIGGVFVTKYESFLYKNNSTIILKLKFIQLLIISISVMPGAYFSDYIYISIFVFLSRAIGWSIINYEYNKLSYAKKI